MQQMIKDEELRRFEQTVEELAVNDWVLTEFFGKKYFPLYWESSVI